MSSIPHDHAIPGHDEHGHAHHPLAHRHHRRHRGLEVCVAGVEAVEGHCGAEADGAGNYTSWPGGLGREHKPRTAKRRHKHANDTQSGGYHYVRFTEDRFHPLL